MSYSDYLWKIARTLRTEVRPGVESEQARETLQNCIRVVTALANSLERQGELPPPQEAGVAPCAVREAIGLPDNPASYLATEGFIKNAAANILNGGASAAAIKSWVTWENALCDAAIARMDAVEAAEPRLDKNPLLVIDPDRLETYLRSAANEPDLRVVQFRTAIGGRSRQTALFEISGAPSLPARLVVQRELPGMKKSAEFPGPRVEFAVLKALHAAGMKTPRPLFLETGDDALGAPFVIVEQSAGRIVEADYWKASAPLNVAIELAQQMAVLHSQPFGELESILPHARETSGRQGWVAELDRFETMWRTQVHGCSIAMEATFRWLRDNVDCVEDRRSIVHNDMVFHNVLADQGGLTAILDWEQASVGHPAEDLGYCYPVVARVMSWGDFMAAYRNAGGLAVSDREVDYFSLRAILRLAVMVQIGRNAFEGKHSDDIVVAGAGAFFLQRLMRRLGEVLADVLERDGQHGLSAEVTQ